MTHTHNENEHDRINDAAQEVWRTAEDLYINHHNGDKTLNRRIMACKHAATTLQERLEAHIENTVDVDDDLKRLKTYDKIAGALWKIGIGVAISFIGYWIMM